jgi:hypothetical protein
MRFRLWHSFKKSVCCRINKGAILWTLWKERDRLCFNDGSKHKNVVGIGM